MTTSFLYGIVTHGRGGAGVVLYISKTHFFHLKIGCGSSTNTIAELLSLWGLLYIAYVMGLPQVKVFGDSNIIID